MSRLQQFRKPPIRSLGSVSKTESGCKNALWLLLRPVIRTEQRNIKAIVNLAVGAAGGTGRPQLGWPPAVVHALK